MKKWLPILVILMALSVLVVPAAAQTIQTEYEGVEYCGEVVGGRQWISDEGVLHHRDGQISCIDIVDDSRISGELLVTVNYNYQFTDFPVIVYGPMWGKVHLSNPGGYWAGSWTGIREELTGFSYIQTVMKGYGNYEGLQARVTLIRENPDPGAPYQIQGVILEPGGH